MGIGLLFLLAPGSMMAQTAGTQGTMASNVPVFASGIMPAVMPGGDELPPNVFQGSLTVSANYDDNVFPNLPSREWDVAYSIQPQIYFEQTRPRLQWKLEYAPGVELSQKLLYQNVFAQKFVGNVVWLVSPHGSLSAEQYYSVSTNIFAGAATTAPGPIIAPNETIYVPNVRQKWLLSHLMYSYQSSAQTTMGIGGAYQLQNFDSIPQNGPTTELIHSQVASGEAYIARQLTARNQLGFQYGAQVLKFQQTDARTTTHSFLVFDQMNLSSQSTLSLYGGPEYSLTSDQVVLNLGFVLITIPVKANQWSGAGGVTYNWTGNRFATLIDFSRRVTNGGAFIGAVELTSGKADLSWRMTRNWSLTSTIAGAEDQLLASSGPNSELRTYSGEVGFRRRLGRDLSINCYYERLNETGTISGFVVGNRDIVGASMQYSFLKPVGR
jgi:hypothetical protein